MTQSKRSQQPRLRCQLDHITDKNTKQLQKLNEATFPLRYRAGFYHNVLEYLDFSRMVFVADIVVGAVCCRVEEYQPPAAGASEGTWVPMDLSAAKKRAVGGDVSATNAVALCRASSKDAAKTLSVSETQERFAFTEEERQKKKRLYVMIMNVLPEYRRRGLGQYMMNWVLKETEATPIPNMTEIALHVQTSNAEALEFYRAQGFREDGIVDDYYAKLEPRSAHFLRKDLGATSA